MNRTDTILLRRAQAALLRTGAPSALPTDAASDVIQRSGRRYVRLGDETGLIAVYRVRNDGILKRLKRWPTAIEAR